MEKQTQLNPYRIFWAVVISNDPIQKPEKRLMLDEIISFSRIGANTLFAPFTDKEKAQTKARELMYKYSIAGRILTITGKQFSLKQSFDQLEPDTKPNVNLAYTITVYVGKHKIVFPLTAKQYSESIVISNENIKHKL